jgi:carboxypeptidase C (cathepsin A)
MILRIFLIILLIAYAITQTSNPIQNLPGFSGGTLPTMFDGYLPVRKNATNLFYWFVQANTNANNAPVIIFMNGGPGCSSLVQLFFENGPFTLVSSSSVSPSPPSQSWNDFANILYLDQPIATGFSTTTDLNLIPSDSIAASQDVFDALVQFFTLFPQYKTNRIYFSGVGYAAKVIAYTVKYAKENSATLALDIRGIALGNAMIKPSIQYGSYADYGYAAGIISYKQRVELNKFYENCLLDIQSGNFASAAKSTCQTLFDQMITAGGQIDPFDVRKLMSDLNAQNIIIDYLNRADVKAALQIPATAKFHKCFAEVANKFLTAEFHSDLPDTLIPTIIDDYKIHVLFYNGQFDVRCNTLGVQETLRQMMWSGRETFNQMSPTIFILPNGLTEQDRIRGHFKTFNYLSLMVVYGGSRDDANNPRSTITTYNLMQRFTSPTSNNLTVVMNSLCTPGTQCMNAAINCPNGCSGHGNCTTTPDGISACQCSGGYSEFDCSIGDFSYQLRSFNGSYSGSMIGREANVFKFVFNPSSSLLGLDIILRTTSPAGTPFMFVNVTSKATAKTGPQIKHIARQQIGYHVLNGLNGYALTKQVHGTLSGGYFQYYNVSHDRVKEIHIKEVDILRGQDNVIAIAVFNNADVPCTFSLEIITSPDDGRIELFGLFVGLSLAFLVVIIVEIMVIMTRSSNRERLQQSIKKSSQHQPMIKHEDDDEEELLTQRQ